MEISATKEAEGAVQDNNRGELQTGFIFCSKATSEFNLVTLWDLPDILIFVHFRPGGTPAGRDRGDKRGGDPRDVREPRGDPRGQRGDPRGEPRGELRPDHTGDQRDQRRRSHGHSPNGYLRFVVEGPPRPMIAVYDYDPIELSPNVDSEVMI